MKRDDLDWTLYRSFLAVLAEGSLSAAARSLGLTQPTLGRHIDMLEHALGAPLFLRAQRGLVPTETAREMQPYAEAMAANAASLLRSATAARDTPQGSVRISASEVVGIEVLPPILAHLQEAHPRIEIELSVSDVVEDLLKREADIAVRMVAPTQGTLVSQRIGAIPLAFFAHRRYLEVHGTPLSMTDLAAHRLIGFDRQLAYVRSMSARYPDIAALPFSLRSDSNLAQLGLIRAGAGIGICQRPLGSREPDLVEVLADAVELDLETFVVMHEHLKLAPRCRVTFDALVAGLKAYIGRAR